MTWWFLTEGYAKEVVVFEPVYYKLYKYSIGNIAKAYILMP